MRLFEREKGKWLFCGVKLLSTKLTFAMESNIALTIASAFNDACSLCHGDVRESSFHERFIAQNHKMMMESDEK